MSKEQKQRIQPQVRYFIPCWKEPSMGAAGPTAHEILYAVEAKPGHSYPLWQRPFFVLLLITNLHGPCQFHLEMHLDEPDADHPVLRTDTFAVHVGNDPLRVQAASVMMKAAQLPQPGVYRLDLLSGGDVLASTTIHAR
jgi:hypothetical protein